MRLCATELQGEGVHSAGLDRAVAQLRAVIPADSPLYEFRF